MDCHHSTPARLASPSSSADRAFLIVSASSIFHYFFFDILAGSPVLTLITCGGSFSESTRHYDSNVVVYAVPVRLPEPGPRL